MRNQFLLYVLIIFSASSFFSCYTYEDMVNDLYVAEAKKKKPQFTYISHDKLERSWMISEIPSVKMQPQNIELQLEKGSKTVDWDKGILDARARVTARLADKGLECCQKPPPCSYKADSPWSPPGLKGHRVIIVNDLFKKAKINSASIQHKNTQQIYFGTTDKHSVVFDNFHTGNPTYEDGVYSINIVLEDIKSGEIAVMEFDQAFGNR